MIQENLRVTAQTVISQMLEGHKTFGDLAQKYGMKEEEFKQIVARVVNDKDYPRLVKANDKYVVARSRIGNNKTLTKKQEVDKVDAEQEQKEMRMEMSKKLSSIEKQIAERNIEMEQSEEKIEIASTEVHKAKENLKLAEQVEENAKKAWQKVVQRLETLNRDKEEVVNKIQEIDSKIIFLIAPNYKGAKPDFGTVISAIPMEGAKVEDVSDTTLTTEMSAEDIFLFDNMEEAKAANEYLKLVTKYFVEDKKYKLLIDSEVLINLLKKQELIEEPDT